jgi:protein-L-isoaspartate(D-aspartate) O-methyltransferase
MSVHGIGMTSQRARTRMLDNLKAQGIADPLVLAAMNAIPRHPFLEESIQQRAYDDTPLPIGQGQTISSPYTVARSCELAFRGQNLERVLEIGGGCGYQAAVLSRLAKEVLSLERIAKLIGKARLTLRELRINNVIMKNVDGTFGYKAAAPFDAIIVAAAMPFIPEELKLQLKPGARLVAPVGAGDTQRLIVVEAGAEGGFTEKELEAVKFVPLLSGVS